MSKRMRLLALGGMLYAGLVAFVPAARAGEMEAPRCCDFGSDCQVNELCCDAARLGALPCDTTPNTGYCRASCQ